MSGCFLDAFFLRKPYRFSCRSLLLSTSVLNDISYHAHKILCENLVKKICVIAYAFSSLCAVHNILCPQHFYRAVAQTIILAARKKTYGKKEQQKKDFSVLRGTRSRYVELHSRKFVMRQGRCFCKPRVCG